MPGEAQPQIARISSSSLLYQPPHRTRSANQYEGSADLRGGLPDARYPGSQEPTSPGQNHSTAAATSAKVIFPLALQIMHCR